MLVLDGDLLGQDRGMNLSDILLLVFSWSAPLVILLIGVLAFGAWKLYEFSVALSDRITDPSVKWFGFAGVAGIVLIFSFICMICYRVYPTESFQDGSGSFPPDEKVDPTLLTDLAAAEDAACKLITRVDSFIQNDVGPAGQSDSQLILDAQMKARGGVTMVDCSSAEAASEDVDHRLTRLESTLKSFTGPELQRTYDTTMRCEGFVGSLKDPVATVEPTPRQRLTTIQATLKDQQTRLLAPVDQKTEDLKKGIASDCDKKKAAAAAQKLPGGAAASTTKT